VAGLGNFLPKSVLENRFSFCAEANIRSHASTLKFLSTLKTAGFLSLFPLLTKPATRAQISYRRDFPSVQGHPRSWLDRVRWPPPLPRHRLEGPERLFSPGMRYFLINFHHVSSPFVNFSRIVRHPIEFFTAGTTAGLFQCNRTSFVALRAEFRNLLVSVEFLSADVFLSDTDSDEHLAHASNHRRRACNVVDRNAQVRNPFGQ